ncbi:MAG: hypothetical protein BAJALOKI1v1_1060011 [Promethearchaeota archaeon]|nr:MAG: hypothetical protein BAJALOKI1v1_1060011 [Candidatus Lokiarchaeota archaeon]
MNIDLSAFKVLIKKIFPPNKCVYTIDLNDNGQSDAILIRAVNVVLPFEIPEQIDIENLTDENIRQDDFNAVDYFQIYLDGEKIDLSGEIINKDVIQERFLLVHSGESFTLMDLLEGKLKGRTIGLGDTIDIILQMDKEYLDRLTEGKHSFTLESEVLPSLTVNFSLSKNNFKLKYELPS